MYANPYLIRTVQACEILDSRGNPTLQAQITLSGGQVGLAAVASGASTGKFEAKELRDQDPNRYLGCGVLTAVANVTGPIADRIIGVDARNQWALDDILCRLDGTENKEQLGANALLAVSLATARAAAQAQQVPLFRHLGGLTACRLPVPFMNILNGGMHAGNNLDIQEFMIVPIGADSFQEAVRCGSEVYHALSALLKLKGLSTAVGDEGGFAPDLKDEREAIELILSAIEHAGYRPGEQVCLALDAAASGWVCKDGGYRLPKQKKSYTTAQLARLWQELCSSYPLISIEDPFGEDDFSATAELTLQLGGRLQIVGDDLIVTNPTRLARAVRMRAANAVLIKPNQIGTLSETLQTIRIAQDAGYGVMISHRSGETDDSFIADLALAVGAGQIKAGAPCRGERCAKYNRLLQLENCLGNAAIYAGKSILR